MTPNIKEEDIGFVKESAWRAWIVMIGIYAHG